jgi:hypothetical protein
MEVLVLVFRIGGINGEYNIQRNMIKRLIYFQFLLILLAACEEYYTPKIDDINGQLVVDAVLTNDSSINYVRLTTTRGYYNEKESFPVLDAEVILIDKNGVILKGTEIATGSFIFNTVPEIGNSYKLSIRTRDNTYESKTVTMPPLPKILNAYSGDVAKNTYEYNTWNNGVMSFNYKGHNIYIDLPVTDSLAYYRFSTRSVLEWYPIKGNGCGWSSIYESKFDIAKLKNFTQADTIKEHPLTWLSYDRDYYVFNKLLSDENYPRGWVIIVDQFGTSKDSYEFHEKLNSQFAADGSFFDRIPGQIDGNISCLTDPSKKAYGFFDLNSYRQYRYNIMFQNSQVVRAFIYPDIPDYGTYGPGFPDWW